ncbi:M1 family metallopeptidase [Kineosporia sp. A_224]|uniref:M1 family metallopeptidase n=1 Tax=Kineosporia sp. A_224 TaxID=1962180 RepID=UPI000B4AF0F4|nr:M1 family metallopeptidase [Kineosporia sp. A_224]
MTNRRSTGRAPAEGSAGDPYRPKSGDDAYRVLRYDIDLDYRVASNRLDATVALSVLTRRATSRLHVDLAGLRVVKVLVDGRPARYAHRGRKLVVTLPRQAPADTALTLSVRYSGSPAPLDGPWGEVGWEELSDGVIVASQPDGAPSWLACNDHPGDKASYRFTVTTESLYTVVCNGSLVDRRAGASRTTWVYESPEPMATYLATVQVGRYRLVDTAMGPVRQRAAVPPRLLAAFDHDFAPQAAMVRLFERVFGPYPFEAYTVVVTDEALEIPLEAQGLSIFGANHVDGRRGSERLVAHELAHQWFGNSLTLGRWQDIWLHEGFAAYAEWLWSQEKGRETADALARKAWQRLSGLPQDLVIADPGPDLMFDDRLYKRGALAVHALRLTMGDAAFGPMLRAWTTEHRHGTVTTAGFEAHAQAWTPEPLGALFTAWLRSPKLPRLPAPPTG